VQGVAGHVTLLAVAIAFSKVMILEWDIAKPNVFIIDYLLANPWQYWQMHGSIIKCMAVLSNAWQYYQMHGSIIKCMAVLSNAWQQAPRPSLTG
jgi:hypothetical protein